MRRPPRTNPGPQHPCEILTQMLQDVSDSDVRRIDPEQHRIHSKDASANATMFCGLVILLAGLGSMCFLALHEQKDLAIGIGQILSTLAAVFVGHKLLK